MDNYFTFNGRGTMDFGMACEKHPNQNAPKRRRTAVQIPGRNGALHYDEGGFENIKIEYSVWFRGDLPTPEQAHAVKGWLLGAKGYSRLIDKYDPGHFRLASFAGPLTVSNILGRYGKCKLQFDCDPRCFRRDGEFPINFENSGILYNPTDFESTPLIYVYGAGAGTVSVAGVVVEILSMTTGMVLDCENLNAYALGDVGQNLNSDISAPIFPALQPGGNAIWLDGGVERVEIVPRWWDL